MTRTPAALVLADGRIFRGYAFGAHGETLGEAVFTTAMTGYQETITDPSYHRQIVVATAPHIGNTGWNDEDSESRGGTIWAAAFVLRDLSHTVSNWRATHSLEEEMTNQGIIGIQGVDTRALVRHLREKGSTAAGVFSGDALRTEEEMITRVQTQPPMAGANLTEDVTTPTTYIVNPEGELTHTIIAYDMGMKTNTPREFSKRGVRTIVVPASTNFEHLTELMNQHAASGVFISNGPGDPATTDTVVEEVKKILSAGIPLFGICFGNQILGRALGMTTYKLTFGHRGINVPVIEHATGRIDITAQNHGFALAGDANEEFDTPFGPAQVTHTCLNDGVVEGVALTSGQAFSVQYHPESAAGPHDANPLFDRFIQRLAEYEARGAYTNPAPQTEK